MLVSKRQIDWYEIQTSPTNGGGEIDDREDILDENEVLETHNLA